MRERPSIIHSAIARATPALCVTQTASATQKPDRSRCSPMRAAPSGVKEKMPLKPSSTLVSARTGSRSTVRSHASAKSSSVKGSIDGMVPSSLRSSRPTGIGRWP